MCRAGWKNRDLVMYSLTKFQTVLLAGTAGLIALGAVAALSSYAAAQGAGVYTAAQADQGLGDFGAKCAGCYRANLAGGGDAPALGGAGFMSSFGNRSTKDLYNFFVFSLSVGAPGCLC